jgi:hypothetical protein
VAPQVASQGPFHEGRVGAFAVDDEELAARAGGKERLAFGVHGLAHPAGADDQPRAGLHPRRHYHQAALVSPAEIPVDLGAQRGRLPVVVAHVRGPPDRGGHARGGLALGALDVGGVDRLPGSAGLVQRGGQQPDRDGQRQLGPQKRARGREVDLWGAELADEPEVAGEVVGQRRPQAALVGDAGGQGDQAGQGEFPPAHPGRAQDRLPDDPGEQGERAERNQQQRHAHGQLPLGGWAA